MGSPARWQQISRTTLARTRVLDLTQARYRHPMRGVEKDFIVVTPPDWVNVVAVTAWGELVLVRQFRFGVDDFTWEVPGGVMHPGEDPMRAGQRELREETGYAGAGAVLLGAVHPNPAIQGNRCHIVLVTDAAPAGPVEWDEDEEIEIGLRPVDEVLALARSGGITHSLVLDALFLFESWWRAHGGRGGA